MRRLHAGLRERQRIVFEDARLDTLPLQPPVGRVSHLVRVRARARVRVRVGVGVRARAIGQGQGQG